MWQRNALWLVAIAAGIVAAVLLFSPAAAVNKNIGNEELVQLQAQGASIIDVRTPAEFEAAHLAGSVNVPIDQLGTVSQGWDKSLPVVVYCATGARSANAAQYLEAQGFRKVYNLSQGIVAWNGATETGSGAGTAALPTSVKTNGKPLFIDFASST